MKKRNLAIILIVLLSLCSCMMPDKQAQIERNEELLKQEGIIALKVGSGAPGFTASSTSGEDVSIPDGHDGATLLFFFPAVETPNSTKNLIELNKIKSDVGELNPRVFAVTGASQSDMSAFHQQHDFDYEFLADPDLEISRQYGCASDTSKYPQRTLVGLNNKGAVVMFKRYLATKDEILEAFQESMDLEPATDEPEQDSIEPVEEDPGQAGIVPEDTEASEE